MFEAELAGKLPELAAYEDYLISCVFGALKYLDPTAGLLPVLAASTNLRGGLSLANYLKENHVGPADVDEAQVIFWLRSTVYGEPDLVVILRTDTQSFIVPIEVKFFSGKHGEEDDDQLLRYYLALSTARGRATFGDDAIREFSGEFLALIYLTQFEAAHEMDATLAQLKSRGLDEAHEKIFHLKWQQIHAVVQESLAIEGDPFRSKVLLDIKELTEHKGLTRFTGFSRLPPGLSPEGLREFPVLFASEKLGERGFSDFPALPSSLSQEILSTRPVFLRGQDQQGKASPVSQ